MIIISENQKKILSSKIPNLESLLKADDLNELLFTINDCIIDDGFTDETNDYLNNNGHLFQRLYDDIYNQSIYPDKYPINNK